MPSGVYTRTEECNKAHRSQRLCNTEGCRNKHHGRGLCKRCYESQYGNQRYQENKEKISKQQKQHYQDNKERVGKRVKRYCTTPNGKASRRAAQHNYRLLTKGLTKEIVQKVYKDNIERYGVLTCYLCFKPIIHKDDVLEHSTPVSRGGNNKYNNLGVAHQSCNNRKHTMTLEEWNSKKEKGVFV